MLTGGLPFPGPDFAAQHLSMPPPAPSSAAPWLGPEIDAIVVALLEKDPQKRPHDALELQGRLGTLPWAKWQLEFDARGAVARAAPASVPPPPDAAAESSRYVRDGAPDRARDTLLQRDVDFVSLDRPHADHVRALAVVSSPHVQAVIALDEPARRLVLERPIGEPLRAPATPREVAELRDAVAAIHARGLVHGAIDLAHLVRGPGRLVLLLPTRPSPATRESDLAAVDALLGD